MGHDLSKLTLSFKGQELKVFPILRGRMVVGSDPGCTLHIDSLAIQPQHAEFVTEGQSTVLKDLDTPDGTFVNQEKVREVTLKDGDLIRIGKHTLTYSYAEIPEEMAEHQPVMESAPVMAEADDPEPSVELDKRLGWVQIMNGQNLGKTLSLKRSITNLGKPGVATACITRRNSGYFISHLEGKRPPQVGNSPVEQPTKLNDGDTITIGNIKMQFYLE